LIVVGGHLVDETAMDFNPGTYNRFTLWYFIEGFMVNEVFVDFSQEIFYELKICGFSSKAL